MYMRRGLLQAGRRRSAAETIRRSLGRIATVNADGGRNIIDATVQTQPSTGGCAGDSVAESGCGAADQARKEVRGAPSSSTSARPSSITSKVAEALPVRAWPRRGRSWRPRPRKLTTIGVPNSPRAAEHARAGAVVAGHRLRAVRAHQPGRAARERARMKPACGDLAAPRRAGAAVDGEDRLQSRR